MLQSPAVIKMTVIFVQVFILFTFVAAGYLLSKFKLVDPDKSGILSTLLVYVVLPCNVFLTFSRNFTVSYVAANADMLISSVIMIFIVMVLANITGRFLAKERYEQYLYEYSFVIPNYGYMGFSLAEALLGEVGLMNIMTFSLPSCVYIYTMGYAMLTRQKLNFRKLINPVIIANILGIIVGLSGFTMPNVIMDICEKATVCMGPISMLLTGIVVAELPLIRIIKKKSVYILILIRTIIFPIALYAILSRFCSPTLTQTAVLFYAMPFGLNTVVFPKLLNENCETGMSLALVSTLTACITLPIVLGMTIGI